MNLETSVTVLTCLMATGITILMAGVPWAYGVHGRLTKIETSLNDHLLSVEQLSELERRITRLEIRHNNDT